MKLPYDPRGDEHRAEPITLTGTVAGDGTLTLIAKQVPPGQRWKVSYITVTTSGSAEPTVNVYIDTSDLRHLLDGTDQGLASVAWYNPPRTITSGETLVVVWQGAQAGARASARIEYDVEAA